MPIESIAIIIVATIALLAWNMRPLVIVSMAVALRLGAASNCSGGDDPRASKR